MDFLRSCFYCSNLITVALLYPKICTKTIQNVYKNQIYRSKSLTLCIYKSKFSMIMNVQKIQLASYIKFLHLYIKKMCSVQSCLFVQCWPGIILVQCRGNLCNVSATFETTGYYQKINQSNIKIAEKGCCSENNTLSFFLQNF